jgi:uncharacterized protein YkwD
MNSVRKSHGLPALRIDFHLVRAARGHSADMMRRQYFAHGSVVGRVGAAGARGPIFGEDLAWSQGITATWVVNAWLASPGHRRHGRFRGALVGAPTDLAKRPQPGSLRLTRTPSAF